MPKISQIRGMLLEEVLLHLLRSTGYSTIENVENDPTLRNGPAGICVKGRGCDHQIDAIADFVVTQPFSYKQRLLVEAKCYSDSIKLPVIRNAVGVLKDVSEFWVPDHRANIHTRRYSYQYAMFSTTEYTSEAQKYAFAHGIYLIPLANSQFLRPVLDCMTGISETDFDATLGGTVQINLKELRAGMRDILKHGLNDREPSLQLQQYGALWRKLQDLVSKCHRINGALLAVLGGCFPVFLVPRAPEILHDLGRELRIRIYWDNSGWYICEANNRENILFSFDLPEELFSLYADKGILTAKAAVEMKEEMMATFHAIKTNHWHRKVTKIELIQFKLDENWLSTVKNRIQENKGLRKQ